MVVNGKSVNFTKTTDAEGNTKLIWGNYEKQADGPPNAYDMVYGTEYEYEGKTSTIVWGYESQNLSLIHILGETLMQRRRVEEEGLRIVNSCC